MPSILIINSINTCIHVDLFIKIIKKNETREKNIQYNKTNNTATFLPTIALLI